MENNTQEDHTERYKIFIEEWRFQLELQKKLFDTLDIKTQWFFALVAGTIWYLVTIEMSKIVPNFNIWISHHLLFLLVIILGFIILWISIFLLNAKPFQTWPHIWKQKQKFSPNKASIQELQADSTLAYIQTYELNESVIWNKGKLFGWIVRLTYFYFICTSFYFLIAIFYGR